MQNASLFKILKRLSADDLIALKKFLKCDYFNRNKNCEKLLTILSQYHPEFTSNKLENEKLFYRVFSKEKSYQKNAANFRTLFSELKKRVNQFLILQELEENGVQKKLLLIDAYRKRGVELSLVKEITKKIDKEEKGISTWYYLNRFLLYWKLYEEEMKDSFNRKAIYFEDLNKNFDYFYALTKLKLGIERTNLVQRKIEVSPLDLLPAIQSFIQQKTAHLPTVLVLYAKLYELMNNQLEEVEDFKGVFNLFKSVISELAKEEAKEIATILHNLSNTKIGNSIEAEVYKKLRFEVLQLGVRQDLYIENEIFIGGIFTNIVISAASVSEFQWATSFIEKYSQLLLPDSKELNLNETNGVLYFLKGRKSGRGIDYKKSIQFFEAPKTRNIRYNKRKIWILLQIHYEHFVVTGDLTILKYSENFHTVINRFKGFTETEKRKLLNTNNTIKFLAKYRLHPNISLKAVKIRVTKFRSMAHYQPVWVTEQIAEFLDFKFPNEDF